MATNNGQKIDRTRRSKTLREYNLVTEIRMYHQGYNYEEIAVFINKENEGKCGAITNEQIRKDLRECRKRWSAEIVWEVNEMRTERLLMLQRIEREAMEAYEESKNTLRRTVSEMHPETKKVLGNVTLTQEARYGDMRCLQTVIECESEIAKLFGLYPKEPVNTDPTAESISWNLTLKTGDGESLKQLLSFPRISLEDMKQIKGKDLNGDGDDSPNGEAYP